MPRCGVGQAEVKLDRNNEDLESMSLSSNLPPSICPLCNVMDVDIDADKQRAHDDPDWGAWTSYSTGQAPHSRPRAPLLLLLVTSCRKRRRNNTAIKTIGKKGQELPYAQGYTVHMQ